MDHDWAEDLGQQVKSDKAARDGDRDRAYLLSSTSEMGLSFSVKQQQ